MKEDRRIKIKQVLPLLLWNLENIMNFVFWGFSFILHLAHHLASLSRSFFVDVPLLNRYFYSRPIGRHHLQIVIC